MIQERDKQITRTQNTKVSRNQTRVKRRNRKQQMNNRKQVPRRKVNREKAHDNSVEILYIFFQTVPTLNLTQNISGNSKQKQKMYVMIYISLSHNMETKVTINEQIIRQYFGIL